MSGNSIDYIIERGKLNDSIRSHFYELPIDAKLSVASNMNSFYPNYNKIDEFKTTSDFFSRYSNLIGLIENNQRICPEKIKKMLEVCSKQESYSTATLSKCILGLENNLYDLLKSGKLNSYTDLWNFLISFFIEFLKQKESGYILYSKLIGSREYYDIVSNDEMPLYKILQEYLTTKTNDSSKRLLLQNMYYSKLNSYFQPNSIFNIVEYFDNINLPLNITYILKSSKIYSESTEVPLKDISSAADDSIADNIGRVNLFGSNILNNFSIEEIKSELIRLNRNTIADFFPKNRGDSSKIDFNIDSETKMMLKEELSPNLCVGQVIRGNEIDKVTLIVYESVIYLLFRRLDIPSNIYGISLQKNYSNSRELIRISTDSDFSYRLVMDNDILSDDAINKD